ncbi:tyrosine--tRNA ligase [Striga asiatica]|uniref:Tyrosine--tRNA ligase n=1 Tax=Striga asiatica TaxID=4170 RepID=A0A5A7Q2T5_STRAF|nr:tyrosine--tRNA ligase [Striga asiatica]
MLYSPTKRKPDTDPPSYGVNNSLNQQASSLNPTVFTQEIPTQQSQTRFMPTPRPHVPGPSMYDQLMGTNIPQPSRATHGPIIRGPAAFTGERPLFSAGSSITSVSAASVVVVDQGKKFMVLDFVGNRWLAIAVSLG